MLFQVECTTCQARTEHTQSRILTKSPEHLLCTIKRFSYDWRNNKALKSLMDVHFGPTISLPPIPEDVNEESTPSENNMLEQMKHRTYGLFAVLVHSGNTSNSGHYYCYVRGTECVDELDLKDSPSSPWMKMNDSRVNVVKGGFNKMRENIRTSVSATGYILLYKRLEKPPDQLRTQTSYFNSPRSPKATEGGSASAFTPLPTSMTSITGKPSKADENEEDDEDEKMLFEALAMSQSQSTSPSKQAKSEQIKSAKNDEDEDGDEVEEVDSGSDDEMALALAMSMSVNGSSGSSGSSDATTTTTPTHPPLAPSTPLPTLALPVSSSPTTLQRQLNRELNFKANMLHFQSQQTQSFLASLRKRQSMAWITSCRDHLRSQPSNKQLPADFWHIAKNRLHLRALGFCGIDDSINLVDLIDVSRDYPFVEWGCLFHSAKTGTSRYASDGMLKQIQECKKKDGVLALF